MNKNFGLDAIDIRILSAVQEHGQLSKTRLAELVNLAPTPCWTRLTRLKTAGFIRGYHADIALDRIADITTVMVTISLSSHRKPYFDRFEAHVRESKDIVECVATSGGTDFIMKVVCPNLTAFQNRMDELLAAELGIERYMAYIITRNVKVSTPDLAILVARNRQSA